MLTAPIPDDLQADRVETLRRYIDLARGIEAVEADKTPPGNLADALFERFDGEALEAAILATSTEGAEEEAVFQVFKAAVDRVYAETAEA